jgi:hypothetical protein
LGDLDAWILVIRRTIDPDYGEGQTADANTVERQVNELLNYQIKGGRRMKNIKAIVAIMTIKTNNPDEVGKFSVNGDSDSGIYLQETKPREIEFVTEDDFEEPKRENFEALITEINDGQHDTDGVTYHFLVEADE